MYKELLHLFMEIRDMDMAVLGLGGRFMSP